MTIMFDLSNQSQAFYTAQSVKLSSCYMMPIDTEENMSEQFQKYKNSYAEPWDCLGNLTFEKFFPLIGRRYRDGTLAVKM